MVILIFIFLTPKRWFESGERAQNMLHQSPVARTLLLSPQIVGIEGDRLRIEQQVKAMTGRTDIEVLAVRKIPDPNGKTLSFEVDIR